MTILHYEVAGVGIWALAAAAITMSGIALLFLRIIKLIRRQAAARKPIELQLEDKPLSAKEGYWFGAGLRKEALRDAQASEPSSVFAIGDWTKDVGNIGELVTTLLHVSSGWRQLPSQPDGDHGIDGVFVRKRSNRQGYEVRFVETKTVTDGDPTKWYDNDQLSAEGLKRRLNTLGRIYSPTGAPHMVKGNIDALKMAIDRQSVHISCLLYGHILKTGKTLIYAANREGALDLKTLTTLDSDEHHYLFEGLAIGLSRFDRKQRYIQDQVAMVPTLKLADEMDDLMLSERQNVKSIGAPG